jgi:tetratricopeptide (TPR) repeat protein
MSLLLQHGFLAEKYLKFYEFPFSQSNFPHLVRVLGLNKAQVRAIIEEDVIGTSNQQAQSVNIKKKVSTEQLIKDNKLLKSYSEFTLFVDGLTDAFMEHMEYWNKSEVVITKFVKNESDKRFAQAYLHARNAIKTIAESTKIPVKEEREATFKECASVLMKMVKFNHFDYRAMVDLALIFELYAEDTKRAEQLYLDAAVRSTEVDPEFSILALRSLAALRLRLENNYGALESLEEAIEKDGNQMEDLRFDYATALFHHGAHDIEEATEIFRSLISRNPLYFMKVQSKQLYGSRGQVSRLLTEMFEQNRDRQIQALRDSKESLHDTHGEYGRKAIKIGEELIARSINEIGKKTVTQQNYLHSLHFHNTVMSVIKRRMKKHADSRNMLEKSLGL